MHGCLDLLAGLPGVHLIQNPGQVLGDHTVDLSVLNIVNHPLKARPVEVCTAPSIVDILVYYGHLMLGSVLPEHHALTSNS